jgi:RNA polymerase sigma-70 factor (ECF subfamily)
LRDEDDGALVTRAVDGDRRELLLDRHADRIHAVCRRIVAHPDDALDATQEAMIAIARGITRFDGRAAFSTWCYRIATNAALDELRRQRRRPVPAHPDAPEPVATGSSPDDIVAARLDVDAALQHVPEEFRVAVVLRDLCDLDYAEIADILDIPAGTVRSRISRGRSILVERLGPAIPGNRVPTGERQNDDG